jgi:hypothetical protein
LAVSVVSGVLSGNAQCAAAVMALNDRLRLARTLEPGILADAADEMAALKATLGKGLPPLQQAISGYHRRRIRTAPDLVPMMHQLRAQT